VTEAKKAEVSVRVGFLESGVSVATCLSILVDHLVGERGLTACSHDKTAKQVSVGGRSRWTLLFIGAGSSRGE
jgi:hypothetical protein